MRYKRDRLISHQSFFQQRGVVIIVSLVLLFVMTVLGVSTLKSSSLELRMVTNTKARQHAFQAAEAALKVAENSLELAGYNEALVKDCASNDVTCYDDQCAGGLCFFGVFGGAQTAGQCRTQDALNPRAVSPWADPGLDVWNTNGKNIDAGIAGVEAGAQYIIEFQCFFENPDGAYSVVYRITALATSLNGRSQVMLQSTYLQ